MAKDFLISGLDIGNSNIRLVVARRAKESQRLEILGSIVFPSSGIHRGVIVDIQEVTGAIQAALEEGSRISGREIEEVCFGVGGSHIQTVRSHGRIAVSRADREISQEDIDRVISAARELVPLPINREKLLVVPQGFIIDGERGIRDPLGMHGNILEVETLIIHGSSPFLSNFCKCIEGAGMRFDDEYLFISPLNAARAVLSKRQKELGVISIDIGGGTTSIAVFEEGMLLHLAILPIGSAHITNDIAVGLQINVDAAEQIKIEYGAALASEISKTEKIDFSKVGLSEDGGFSRREVANIIEARLSEIFDLVNKELSKIGKAHMLPAGAVITGGGAKTPFMVDLAKKILRLPCQVGFPQETEFEGIIDRVNDPSFSSVSGIVLLKNDDITRWKEEGIIRGGGNSFGSVIKKIFRKIAP